VTHSCHPEEPVPFVVARSIDSSLTLGTGFAISTPLCHCEAGEASRSNLAGVGYAGSSNPVGENIKYHFDEHVTEDIEIRKRVTWR
jgi:hypothetical protein